MSWLFSITNLRPVTVLTNMVAVKTVLEQLPLTPFWARPAGIGTRRGIELDGADFFRQSYVKHTDTETPPSTDLTFECGSKTYRNYLETYTNEGPDCGEIGFQSYTPQSSIDYHYDFSIRGKPIRNSDTYPGQPYFSYPRSATEWNFDHGPADPPITYGCSRRSATGNASNEVTKAWMEGQLADWQALDGAVKDDLYSGYPSPSFKTESTEGWKLRIGFHEVRPQGFWFSGTPFGMTGDLGELWNGSYSTWVIKETRKNFPSVWSEVTMHGSAIFPPDRWGPGFPTTGESIYKAGYYEAELSDEITGQFVDQYGVFEFGGVDDWDLALQGCPYQPVLLQGIPAANSHDFTSNSRGEEEGECNELLLISATGKRYRVTIEVGVITSEWNTEDSIVLETDEQAGQITHRFGPSSHGKQIRVAMIEVWANDAWTVLADVAAWDSWKVDDAAFQDDYWQWESDWFDWYYGGEIGPEPQEPEPPGGEEPQSPGRLIGTSPFHSRHLISAGKFRNGSEFGFGALDYSTDQRFAKRTFRKHRTPGTFDMAGKVGCGAASFSGSFDLEYYEEYVDGELKDPVVTQWHCEINGVAWTPEDWWPFGQLPPVGEDVETPTLRRFNLSGTWDQFVTVAFDSPNANGQLISTDHSVVPMQIDGSTNRGPWTEVNAPETGYAVYVPGHRLTHTPSG